MFKYHIRKLIEVYVNNMLVKSKRVDDHVKHLKEAFNILRLYGMKLNPLKWAFGISSGKFLDFIVHERGIEANPKKKSKCWSIWGRLILVKEVQSLTGKIATLSWFVSKAIDRCLSLMFCEEQKGLNGMPNTKKCSKTWRSISKNLYCFQDH